MEIEEQYTVKITSKFHLGYTNVVEKVLHAVIHTKDILNQRNI